MAEASGTMNLPKDTTISSTSSLEPWEAGLRSLGSILSSGRIPGVPTTTAGMQDLSYSAPQQATSSAASSPGVSSNAQRNTLPSSNADLLDFKNLTGLLGSGGSSISDAEILAAITPTMQTGQIAQLPPFYIRDIPNPPEPNYADKDLVGKGNERGQAIGNVISAGVHGLAMFKAARDRQQEMVDAPKVQRFIEAQNAISMAQQIKPGQPGYEDAQKTIQTNQQLMQMMLSDKKFEKLIEKGFNISLTDPSENKTKEHGIVQKGIDLFKKKNNQPFTSQQTQAMQQRFSSAQPQVLGPNIMAQQMLQYKMLQNQQYQKLFQSLLPRIFSESSRDRRFELTQAANYAKEMRKYQNDAWKLGQQFANSKWLADLRHTYRLDEIQYQTEEQGDKARELLHDKNLDPINLFKSSQAFDKFSADTEAKFNRDLATVNSKIAAAQATPATNQTDAEGLKRTINDLTSLRNSIMLQQKNFQDYKGTIQGIYDNLRKLSQGATGVQGGQGNAPTAGTGAGQSSQQPATGGAPQSGGAFNPQTYLNPVQPGSGAGPPAPSLPNPVQAPTGAGGGGSSNPDEDDDDDELDDDEF